MKRLFHSVCLLFAALLMLSSCSSKYSEVRISSVGLSSFTMEGTKQILLDVELGIDNPAPSFTLRNINATLKAEDRDILYLTCDELTIEGRTDKVYSIPVTANIAQGVNIFYILGAVQNLKDKAFMLDFSANAKLRGGFGKTIEYKDIPLSQLSELL